MDVETEARLMQDMEFERDCKAPHEGFPRLPEISGGRYVLVAFVES